MCFLSFFFFNDTATTEIYTLSLHDALPICVLLAEETSQGWHTLARFVLSEDVRPEADRKSTRLNSSHANISYAVFCLKKKKIYLHRNRTLKLHPLAAKIIEKVMH